MPRKPHSETHKGQVQIIRRLIADLGGRCYVTHQVGRVYGSKGLPDMHCIVRGLAFWLEVKVGRDKLSKEQAEFKALSEAAGVPVVVGRACDVVDWLETEQEQAQRGRHGEAIHGPATESEVE